MSRAASSRYRDLEILESRIAPAAVANLDLSSLTGTNGFSLSGVAANDRAGFAVSDAGDVNGDGFDDVIVGANLADPNGLSSGSSYVFFGQAAGFPANFDLSTLNGTNGFKLNGLALGDNSGGAVSAAGDVNADGFGDLIVGAFGADLQGIDSGISYVVFGRASFSSTAGTLELSSLDGATGFTISGVAAGDSAGRAVNAAGDVNGDGIDDLIIGAATADANGTDSGASYVVFGRTGVFAASLDLSTLTGANGFKLSGVTTGDGAGSAVSTAGDMNGDGIGDLIIGANLASPHGTKSGASYVVFGQAGGFAANVDLSGLDGTDGFKLSGVATSDYSGRAVSTAGDINGDGFDDLIIGAFAADPHGSRSGISYVVFGKAGSFTANLDLSSLDGSRGFTISGVAAYNYSGVSVSAAGDVNGDGFDDVIAGAFGAAAHGTFSGASYVVFGHGGAFTTDLDLSSLTGTNGFKLSGVAIDDRSGGAVSAAGDVNGDGFDDVIVGALGADPHGTYSGTSYVVFGFDTGAVTHPGSSIGETLPGTASANVMIGGQAADTLLGNGGADVLRGGEGGDILAVSDLSFLRIAGGRGTDTLRLDGSGLALDLTTLADSRLTGIERIDIRGSGNNTLSLDLQEVLRLSGESNTLLVRNDAADSVGIGAGWSIGGPETIGGVSYTVFTQGAAALKIENPTPFIGIANASVVEGNNGTTSLIFTLTRGSSDLGSIATVDFTTADGTALAGQDYTAKSGTVTFGAGVATRTIAIDLTGETLIEPNETLFINLSNATGATLFGTQAQGTIINDDATLALSADRKTASFRDVDGDIVTVKTSKAVLDEIDFHFRPGGGAIGGVQLEKLDLHDIGATGAGTTLAITAKRGPLGGDGFVNIGAIDATGVNLGAVSITGDLGQIDAGTGTAAPAAIASLTVGSLGGLGLSTQASATASLQSDIVGTVGILAVKTDFDGAALEVTGGVAGKIGGVTIGGSLVGGAASLSGSITATGTIGAVTIGGNVLGNFGADSASIHGAKITSLTVKGSILGGAGPRSAVIKGDSEIGAVSVKHDIRGGAAGSGAIVSGGKLGAVSIVGDLAGGTGDFAGSVSAATTLASVTIGGSMAGSGLGRTGVFAGTSLGPVKVGGSVLSAVISAGGDAKGLTVTGSVRSSKVLAGVAADGTPVTSDVLMGSIVVAGDWIGSSAAAGIAAGFGQTFGDSNDAVIAGPNPAKFSRIASISIAGEARGTDSSSDSFAFTAEQIGSVKIGRTVFPLTVSATAEDELFVGPTFDLRVRELDAVQPAIPANPPAVPASTLAFFESNRAAKFTDVDGDLVTVRTDKGTFDANSFVFTPGPNGGAILQTLALAGDPEFVGKNASLTISAARTASGGDGWVDVGAIDAAGVDLVNVTVGGDLGQIDAGNADSATPALASLTVHSLGGRGLNTQIPGASTHSDLVGRVGSLTIVADLDGAAFTVNGGATAALGSIGKATVGGSIIGGGAGQVAEIAATGDVTTVAVKGDIRGGSALHSGRIAAGGKIVTLTVGGSLIGGPLDDAGSVGGEAGIGTATVGRSLAGASGKHSGSVFTKAGNITSIKVGGDLLGGAGDQSGSIFATGSGDLGAIGAVTVGGSLFATAGARSGVLSDSTLGAVLITGEVRGLATASAKISAEGLATPADALKALAIKSLTIGGGVHLADILAGFDSSNTLTNADVQIGVVTVKGAWAAGNLLAGVSYAGAIFSTGEQAAISARIASIVIAGSVLGTSAVGDSFALGAQQVGSMKIGLTAIPLTANADDLPLGSTGDTRVREVA